MNKKQCCLLLAMLALPTFAWAKPAIDPELLPLLRATGASNTDVVAILRPKDRYRLPALPTTRAAHARVMRAMMKNAAESQAPIMTTLRSAHQQQQGRIKANQLWLVNAIIAKVPVSVFQQLSNDENLVAINANRVRTLIAPQRRGRVLDQTFTYGLRNLQVPELRTTFPDAMGTGVPVAILDTGIDPNHPDLAGKIANWRDFTGNAANPLDDHGHGSHVAGTVAGGNKGGTSIGVAPGARLIIGKIFTGAGSTTDAIILSAMQWAADPDANPDTADFPVLVSNSWGGGPPSSSADPTKDIECQAVTGWKKLGILPVFAAGNSGPRAGSVGLPGACPDAFSVGAVDEDDRVASFSSRGPTRWGTGILTKPEISAPGVDVLSAKAGGGYVAFSGTSMATPHVAGLAALIYQRAPQASVDQVAQLIGRTSLDLGRSGHDTDFGIGRINALRAIEAMAR